MPTDQQRGGASEVSGLRALLEHVVDYAGLFPPASLSMPRAVEAFAVHRVSADAWMLGRLLVPAGRLDELAQAAAPHLPEAGAPWTVSALLGDDPAADVARALRFGAAHEGRAVVDAVEGRAVTAEAAARLLDAVPPHLAVFIELPLDPERALLEVLHERKARAMIRAGGLVAEAIPSPEALARFVVSCRDAGLRFKATGGPHHPVRGTHALASAPGGPRAMMHGFLNLFAAAAFVRAGHGVDVAEATLREERPTLFHFDAQGLTLGRLSLSTAQVAEAREDFALGFASCSFAEPVAELRGLGLL
jgi:hypothetical protein